MKFVIEIAADRELSEEELRLAKEKAMDRHNNFVLDYQADFKRRTGLNIKFDHAEKLLIGTVLKMRDIRNLVLRRQFMVEHPWAFKPNKYLRNSQ